MVVVRRVQVRSLISETKLGADFVINPYVGCPHNCVYCYARCMMLTRSPHKEEWGDYLDVKVPARPLPLDKLFRRSVLFSSMTDAYNPYEERAEITRSLLKELLPAECTIAVITKSALVARDLDLFRQFPRVKVTFSFSSLDDGFRRQAEPHASSPQKKLAALKLLHEAGIETAVFVAPTFPGITDPAAIVHAAASCIDKINFDTLHMRKENRQRLLDFVGRLRPDLASLYDDIFIRKNNFYWLTLQKQVQAACREERLACGRAYRQ